MALGRNLRHHRRTDHDRRQTLCLATGKHQAIVGLLLYWAVGLYTGRSGYRAEEYIAIPGLLINLTVYLFMNLGAFLAIDARERQLSSDDIGQIAGLERRLPVTAVVLAIRMLSLAG